MCRLGVVVRVLMISLLQSLQCSGGGGGGGIGSLELSARVYGAPGHPLAGAVL